MMDHTSQISLLQHFAITWGAAAWRSYRIQGRGILSVHIQTHGDDTSLVIDYLSGRECNNATARRLASIYDPKAEYILLLTLDDDTTLCDVINLGYPLADIETVMSSRIKHDENIPMVPA